MNTTTSHLQQLWNALEKEAENEARKYTIKLQGLKEQIESEVRTFRIIEYSIA